MYNFRGIYSDRSFISTEDMQSPIFIGRNKLTETSESRNLNSTNGIRQDKNSRKSHQTSSAESAMRELKTNGSTSNSTDHLDVINLSNGSGQRNGSATPNGLVTNKSNNGLPDVLISDEYNNGRIRTLTLAKPEYEEINIGFNLTRSQWDPYPWVKCVDKDSCAQRAGLQEGDCLIKIGNEDLLGLKISDVANLVRSQQKEVSLLVWSAGPVKEGDSDSLLLGPLPLALTRLSSCLASILRSAECPVCARTIPAPAHQCPSGHLLCSTCRSRMEYCPLCRSAIGMCRNLLADEVYNCVLENFDLRPEKRDRLTRTLFGEDAKFIENHGTRTLGTFQETSRQAKWGTQKLLDRLLPNRARSTGNIARLGGSRTRILSDERDVSRSLSTLDIARCSTDVSPSHSLPSTAAVSCDSLQNARYAVDQNELSNRAVKHEIVVRNNCPVSEHCRGTIAGDVQSHIVLSHDVEVLLKPTDGTVKLENREGIMVSLLHKSGLWFYPKYFRDETKKGTKIWCWIVASSEVASKYQMNVEVRKLPTNTNKRLRINKRQSVVSQNEDIMVVSAIVHSSQEQIEEEDEDSLSSLNNINNQNDDGICIIIDNNSNEDEITNSEDIEVKMVENIENSEPILKFNAPIVSLVEFGWNEVLNHGNKSVFLSDYILNDSVEVVASILEINN